MADSSEKTEQPSAERRKKARADGSFARSRDASGVAASCAVIAVFATMGPRMYDSLLVYCTQTLREPFALVRGAGAEHFQTLAGVLFTLTGPPLAAAAFAAAAVTIAQAGILVTPEALMPKWSRLDPGPRIAQIFAPGQALLGLATAFAPLFLVGYVAYSTLRDAFPLLLQLSHAGVAGGAHELVNVTGRVVIRLLIVLVVLAVIDYGKNWFQTEKQLKMSRQELKEERKNQEGDPMLKARLRARARERIRAALRKHVKVADVVVTNPTHVAVALQYRPGEGAPLVTAKGYDEIALFIRELAKEANIPIVENPPLARALAKRVKRGKRIPGDMYAAVAEVLAFVYRLRGRQVRRQKS